MHIALVTLNLHGHLNPIRTLGREIESRGHEVTLIAAKGEDDEPGFRNLGTKEDAAKLLKLNDQMTSLRAYRQAGPAVRFVELNYKIILRDLAGLLQDVDAIVTDELLQLPVHAVADSFSNMPVVIASAVVLQKPHDCFVPLFDTPFGPTTSWAGRQLNRTMFIVFDCVMRSGQILVKEYRRENDLQSSEDSATIRLQVTQLPSFFDFPRSRVPDHVFFTQPWVTMNEAPAMEETEWNRKLNGRPLVYATLGTLSNGFKSIFRKILKAATKLEDEVQLVLTLGRKGATLKFDETPADAIICDFAPQKYLLSKAAAVITVGGINTVMESLLAGVPMVMIPLGSEQPGNAARARELGVAKVITHATSHKIKSALSAVLTESRYRDAALECKRKLDSGPRLSQTAELVEAALLQDKPLTRDSETAKRIFGNHGDPVMIG